jgi:metabolite-proton symporter
VSTPRRVIVASLIGTSLEWYDFFLYGSAAALVFGRLFFPQFEALTGTLLAFTTYAVGFVARPLGGVVFGHYGDRIGRRNVLVVTLILMGAATFAIGLVPTYAAIGLAAPILLVTLRFLQGLGLGGEWGGAVIMSVEHGAAGRRGLNASWPQVGVPTGNLLATAVLWVLNSTLSDAAFLSWGWRIPFLLSGVLVLVGLWIRLTITESPLFAEVEQSGAKAKLPLVEVLRRHPRGLLVAMAARIGTDVAFYTYSLYVLTYVTTTLRLPRSVGLAAVLIGSALQLALIPLFGALSDRIGRRPVYAIGAAGAALWAFAFFPLLDTENRVVIVLATVVALATHAAMYGPQAAFIVEMFSTRLRYSGASMGYQIAGILGGALAPIISIRLVQATGSAFAVSGYVFVALMITLVALWFAPETYRADLQDKV